MVGVTDELEQRQEILEDECVQKNPGVWQRMIAGTDKVLGHRYLRGGKTARERITTGSIFISLGYVARGLPGLRTAFMGLAGLRAGDLLAEAGLGIKRAVTGGKLITPESLRGNNNKPEYLAQARAQLAEQAQQQDKAGYQRLREAVRETETSQLQKNTDDLLIGLNNNFKQAQEALERRANIKYREMAAKNLTRVAFGAAGAMYGKNIVQAIAEEMKHLAVTGGESFGAAGAQPAFFEASSVKYNGDQLWEMAETKKGPEAAELYAQASEAYLKEGKISEARESLQWAQDTVASSNSSSELFRTVEQKLGGFNNLAISALANKADELSSQGRGYEAATYYHQAGLNAQKQGQLDIVNKMYDHLGEQADILAQKHQHSAAGDTYHKMVQLVSDEHKLTPLKLARSEYLAVGETKNAGELDEQIEGLQAKLSEGASRVVAGGAAKTITTPSSPAAEEVGLRVRPGATWWAKEEELRNKETQSLQRQVEFPPEQPATPLVSKISPDILTTDVESRGGAKQAVGVVLPVVETGAAAVQPPLEEYDFSDISGRHGLYGGAEQFVQKVYADELNKFEAGSKEYQAALAHHADRIKDLLVDGIKNNGGKRFGLGGATDPDKINQKQFAGINWEEVQRAVQDDSVFHKELRAPEVENIVAQGERARAFFHEHPQVPRSSANIEAVMTGKGESLLQATTASAPEQLADATEFEIKPEDIGLPKDATLTEVKVSADHLLLPNEKLIEANSQYVLVGAEQGKAPFSLIEFPAGTTVDGAIQKSGAFNVELAENHIPLSRAPEVVFLAENAGVELSDAAAHFNLLDKNYYGGDFKEIILKILADKANANESLKKIDAELGDVAAVQEAAEGNRLIFTYQDRSCLTVEDDKAFLVLPTINDSQPKFPLDIANYKPNDFIALLEKPEKFFGKGGQGSGEAVIKQAIDSISAVRQIPDLNATQLREELEQQFTGGNTVKQIPDLNATQLHEELE